MDEPTRRRIRHLNRCRIRAEDRAKAALDDPDHVWANQRRVLRRENRALQRKAEEASYRAYSICRAVERLAAGETLDSLSYIPDTTRAALLTLQQREKEN